MRKTGLRPKGRKKLCGFCIHPNNKIKDGRGILLTLILGSIRLTDLKLGSFSWGLMPLPELVNERSSPKAKIVGVLRAEVRRCAGRSGAWHKEV